MELTPDKLEEYSNVILKVSNELKELLVNSLEPYEGKDYETMLFGTLGLLVSHTVACTAEDGHVSSNFEKLVDAMRNSINRNINL